MFCPKCGIENPEGVKFCRSCSEALPVTMQTAPAITAKTSALAITAFVLGILSFCTFLLTAPLAFILGLVSLIMISRSRGQLKGTGMAVASIVIPMIAVLFVAMVLGILLPVSASGMLEVPLNTLAKIRMFSCRMVCKERMTTLGQSMLQYAEKYNEYPTSSQWCDLLQKYDPNLPMKTFHCIGVKEGPCCNYAMNKNIAEVGSNAPEDMVLLFESKAGWNQTGGPELLTMENHQGEGCNILFCDGHAKFVLSEDIDELRWTAEL
ncbi:MAG: DUF4190 domain-containing protein [Planctomycetota bacterium]